MFRLWSFSFPPCNVFASQEDSEFAVYERLEDKLACQDEILGRQHQARVEEKGSTGSGFELTRVDEGGRG